MNRGRRRSYASRSSWRRIEQQTARQRPDRPPLAVRVQTARQRNERVVGRAARGARRVSVWREQRRELALELRSKLLRKLHCGLDLDTSDRHALNIDSEGHAEGAAIRHEFGRRRARLLVRGLE